METYHIIYRGKLGWSLNRHGGNRALRIFTERQAAISAGKILSRKDGVDLCIHRQDGMVDRIIKLPAKRA